MRRRNRVVCWLLIVSSGAFLLGGCGILGGPGREQRVLNALHSKRPEQRRRALSDLAGKPATSAVRKAVEHVLYTDVDPTARAFAAEALGSFGGQESVEQLRLSAQRDISWVVRRRALRALVSILGGDAAEDIEFSISKDRHPTVQIEAIELAAEAGAARMIVEALQDPSTAVRLAAYQHLRRLTGLDMPPDDYEGWRGRLEGQ